MVLSQYKYWDMEWYQNQSRKPMWISPMLDLKSVNYLMVLFAIFFIIGFSSCQYRKDARTTDSCKLEGGPWLRMDTKFKLPLVIRDFEDSMQFRRCKIDQYPSAYYLWEFFEEKGTSKWHYEYQPHEPVIDTDTARLYVGSGGGFGYGHYSFQRDTLTIFHSDTTRFLILACSDSTMQLARLIGK
jgi:hypothetical protein